MNLTFRKRVLLSQYFVVFCFIIFCLIIFINIRDTNDNKVHLVRESFEQYRQAAQSKYDISQIQESLSSISATKGQDGLNNGFKRAEDAYKELLANLESLKKNAGTRNDQALIKQVDEITALANDYYFTAVEMANVYIANGTKDGNEFMVTTNEVASLLVDKITILFKGSNEKFLTQMNSISEKTSLIKSLSMWGPLIVILLASLFIVVFAKKLEQSLREVVRGLVENSSDLEEASLSLFENSQQLFESVEQESREMELTSTALHQISTMVDNNADYSSKAKDATVKTVEVTEAGIKTLENVLNAIENLAASNSHMVGDMVIFNKDVAEMVTVISEIDNKTKIINDIVFQTKLLSFNASVEAARAGEAGKGFAVVAEEINNLAAMSGTAAKDITDMLNKSIEKVGGIIKDSEVRIQHISKSASQEVAASKKVVDEAKQAMSSILENITVVEDMNKEIVVASEEQSTGVRDINKSLAKITFSIKNNQEVAEGSAEQSKILTGQATKLSGVINQFLIFIEGEKNVSFNFNGAVSAHLAWRRNLNNYLQKPDGSLKEANICKDNQCALGQWIYGEGQAYSNHHEFSDLVSTHATFHKSLGEIVALINSGEKEKAIFELRPQSKYTLSSQKVVQLIKELQKEVG